MEHSATIAIIGTLVSLIALLVAILNIRDQPFVKAALLIVMAFILLFFFWFISPNLKIKALIDERQRLTDPDKAKTELSIQTEQAEIADAQRRKEKAEQEAQADLAEQKEAEARSARDQAAAASLELEQHVEKLQEATKISTDQDLRNAILGTFVCKNGSADLTFKPDGIVSPSYGFGETYKIIDSTHVDVTSFYGYGITWRFDMDLTSPVQSVKKTSIGFDCTRPKK